MEKNAVTRAQIVAAADRLFYERGIEHTSFTAIADVVRISRGNFYCFKAKDDILHAVIEARLEARRRMLLQWQAQEPEPAGRIGSYPHCGDQPGRHPGLRVPGRHPHRRTGEAGPPLPQGSRRRTDPSVERRKGDQMFVVLLRFAENSGAAGEHLPGHQQWIEDGVRDGVFLRLDFLIA